MIASMYDLIEACGHDAAGFNDHIGDLETFGSVDEAMRWVIAWEVYNAPWQPVWPAGHDYMGWLEREANALVGNIQASAEVAHALDLLNESVGLDPEDMAPVGAPVFYMPLNLYLRGHRNSCGDLIGSGDVLARGDCAECQGPFVELTPWDWWAEGAPRDADAWMGPYLDPAVFRGCKAPDECQAVIDRLCGEAGTDADPAYDSYGPLVVFRAIRVLDLY